MVCSYIIHFRKDSEKRLENLITVRNFYKRELPDMQFIVIEDDSEQKFDAENYLYEGDVYKFIKNDSTYIRPQCFNTGASLADSDVIVAGDTDVIVHPKYIKAAAKHIRDGDVSFIYPYNGMFIIVGTSLRKKFNSTLDFDIFNSRIDKISHHIGVTVDDLKTEHTQSKGGCVMFNKKHFEEFGGYNPNFIGWGFEDDEIFTRASKLGYTPGRISSKNAIAWHLEHDDPSGDKRSHTNPHYRENMELTYRVNQMPRQELEEYVGSWNKSVGLLIIATNKYAHKFLSNLIESADRWFNPTHNVEYFVFTDQLDIKINSYRNVNIIPTEHKEWPWMTLGRYNIFNKNKNTLKNVNYLFYCDADMLFCNNVGHEILAERVATIHPGFNGSRGTPETNPKSLAFVHPNEKMQYFAGGFNGGSSDEYLKMCEVLDNNIQEDFKSDIIAIWHDESHMNRYFIDNQPTKILDSSYCYPESYPLAKSKKLLALDKNHKEIRS